MFTIQDILRADARYGSGAIYREETQRLDALVAHAKWDMERCASLYHETIRLDLPQCTRDGYWKDYTKAIDVHNAAQAAQAALTAHLW